MGISSSIYGIFFEIEMIEFKMCIYRKTGRVTKLSTFIVFNHRFGHVSWVALGVSMLGDCPRVVVATWLIVFVIAVRAGADGISIKIGGDRFLDNFGFYFTLIWNWLPLSKWIAVLFWIQI